MLFGDRRKLGIEVRPLMPSWERRYPPEEAAWGTLSIWVASENICRNVVESTDAIRDGVNVPLAPLADWLVRSWTFLKFQERPEEYPPRYSPIETLRGWGLARPPRGIDEEDWIDSREEWWSKHFLAAGSDGAQVPNVCFVRTAESMIVEWAPPKFVGERAPSFVRQSGQAAVRWDEAEGALAAFVASIAEWLRREHRVQLYPWVQREDPLRECEVDLAGAIAAYTGHSLDFIQGLTDTHSEGEVRKRLGLEPADVDPSGSVITQILRDLPPRIPLGIEREIIRVDDETREVAPLNRAVREMAVDAAKAGETPEESGQLAADEVRRQLNLDGEPVSDLDGLLADLGVIVRDSGVECNREGMLAGARDGGSAVAVVNSTPRTRVSWGRRFELARALATLLIGSFRKGTLGAASSDFTQPWMRRCSGAFAAEFLLPASGVLARGFGDLDSASEETVFRGLLEDFGVGARTAAYHLWNHGLLSSAQIRDDLIDKFARGG